VSVEEAEISMYVYVQSNTLGSLRGRASHREKIPAIILRETNRAEKIIRAFFFCFTNTFILSEVSSLAPQNPVLARGTRKAIPGMFPELKPVNDVRKDQHKAVRASFPWNCYCVCRVFISRP
jgi:hypothetical protein